MAKLDRLGWAAGCSFISHGVRVGIRANQPEVLERVTPHLPPGWKPARSPVVDRLYSLRVGGADPSSRLRRYNLLYVGPARLARTMELDEVFEPLESDLQLYVAEATRQKVFVHAGVVGWRGRAILLPGRSFAGKSTLVAALVRAGATYYSDEYAVLDARGRVHPYPKLLSIREGARERPGKWPPEALGGRSGNQPLPVGLIAVCEYRPGARWRPRPLSPGQAVLALLANTVPARTRPAAALAVLHQAAAGATVLRGVRGEADHLVGAILQNLDS
jgi:hypothetical protein